MGSVSLLQRNNLPTTAKEISICMAEQSMNVSHRKNLFFLECTDKEERAVVYLLTTVLLPFKVITSLQVD